MSHIQPREGRVDSVSPFLCSQGWTTEQDLMLEEHGAAVRAPRMRGEGWWVGKVLLEE